MTETIHVDPTGDVLELHATEHGIYVTVDQCGVIATAGPFKENRS